MQSKSVCVFLFIIYLSSSLSFCSAAFPSSQAALSFLRRRYKQVKPFLEGNNMFQGFVGGIPSNYGGPIYCTNGDEPNNDYFCVYSFYSPNGTNIDNSGSCEYDYSGIDCRPFYYVCSAPDYPCSAPTISGVDSPGIVGAVTTVIMLMMHL